MRTSALPSLLAVALLTACGGGGGESSNFSAPAISSAPVTISADNQKQVGVSAYDGVVGSSSATGFGARLAGGVGRATFNLYDFVRQQTALVESQRQRADAGGQTHAAVNMTLPMNCDGDGTMTLSYNVDNLSTPTAGDVVSINFSRCDDGQGEITNGSITMTWSTASAMSMNINNFRVSENGVTSVIHGILNVSRSITESVTTQVVTSDALYLLHGGVANVLLTGLSATTVSNSLTLAYAKTFSANLASSLLNGAIEVSGTTSGSCDFFDDDEDCDEEDPTRGDIDITGANGSTLNVAWVDRTSVTLTLNRGSAVGIAWTEFEQ